MKAVRLWRGSMATAGLGVLVLSGTTAGAVPPATAAHVTTASVTSLPVTTAPATSLPVTTAPATSLTVTSAAAPATSVVVTEPPQDVVSPVTDLAGALTSAERAEVEGALATLRSEHGIAMHVVLVDGFDGMDGTSWSERTFDRSGLGSDDALLAVAVGERRYGFVEETDVSADRATQVAVEDVEPLLRTGDWGGAAVALAEGYGEPDVVGSRGWWATILGLLGAAGAAVLGVFGLRTRSDRRSEAMRLLNAREELSHRLGPARERLERFADEEGYIEAALSEQDVNWAREEREQGESLLDQAVTRLEPVPREIGWWPPRERTLRGWMSGVDGARSRLDRLEAHLEATEVELAQARAVVDDPGIVDAARAELTTLQERHRQLVAGAESTTASVGGGSTTASHGEEPPAASHGEESPTASHGEESPTAEVAHGATAGTFLRRRRAERLAEAEVALGAAARAQAPVPELVRQRQGRLAVEALEGSRVHLATATEALGRVNDPQSELDQLEQDITAARERLNDLIPRARRELEQHETSTRQAARVGRGSTWAELSPDVLAGALQAAQDAVGETRDPDDPEPQMLQMRESAARLETALQPYDKLRAALDRERQRARAAAAAAEASQSSSSGRRSSSSRSRSSNSRSRSRSRSSSRSRSRSRSSSRRSSGGGRF